MPGDVIIVAIPHYWGKGEDTKEAMLNVPSTVREHWTIWSVHPKTYIDGMGSLVWYEKSDDHPDGHEPVKLCASDEMLDYGWIRSRELVKDMLADGDRPTPPKTASADYKRGWDAYLDSERLTTLPKNLGWVRGFEEAREFIEGGF
jgi:hypothetical protein